MSDSCVVEGGSHTIRVDGSLSDNSELTVQVNDEQPRVVKREGTINDAPASLTVTTPDGVHVEEKPGVQKITFPDGLKIEDKPAVSKATLPDGTKIKNTPGGAKVTPGTGTEAEPGSESSTASHHPTVSHSDAVIPQPTPSHTDSVSNHSVTVSTSGESNVSVSTSGSESSVSVESHSQQSTTMSMGQTYSVDESVSEFTTTEVTWAAIGESLIPGWLTVMVVAMAFIVGDADILILAGALYTIFNVLPAVKVGYALLTHPGNESEVSEAEGEEAVVSPDQFDFIDPDRREEAVGLYEQYLAEEIPIDEYEDEFDELMGIETSREATERSGARDSVVETT